METYTIDNETNNITAHGSTAEAEAVTGVERFSTAAEFAELASNWPSDRLVEIWNGLPGFTPVKRFKDRKTAIARIWKAIERLDEPETRTTAPVAATKANAAPAKAKSTRKARKEKRAPKGQHRPTTPRDGSKKAEVLALLQRIKGATLVELMNATAWQAHSVRGFLSGSLGKKMGLQIESTKREDGERVYRLPK
jgi:hypothetical protein